MLLLDIWIKHIDAHSIILSIQIIHLIENNFFEVFHEEVDYGKQNQDWKLLNIPVEELNLKTFQMLYGSTSWTQR